MARNGISDLGGFRISPIVPAGTTQPAAPHAPYSSGESIEKGFSSTPTASDAVALKPADVYVPVGDSGSGNSGNATSPTTTASKATK